MIEHRRAQVAAEAHPGPRTEVDRPDRAQHLQTGDREHHRAEPDDGGGVALGDAVVDDRGVDRRQVQRRQGADQLQHHEHRDQPAVRPDVLAQQCQEHLVTVAHVTRSSPAAPPVGSALVPRSGMSAEMPAQVACRWLTRWAAATVHRVTSSRLGNGRVAMRRNARTLALAAYPGGVDDPDRDGRGVLRVPATTSRERRRRRRGARRATTARCSRNAGASAIRRCRT